MRTQIGAAWTRPQASDPTKKRVDVLIDLGILGALPCRLVEVKAETDKHPTHKLVYNEGDTDGIFFGSFWKATAVESGREYLRGVMELHRLGKRLVRGGVVVEFGKLGEKLHCKIVEAPKEADGAGPDRLVMRFTPRKSAAAATAAVPGRAGVDREAGKVVIEDMPPVEDLAPDMEEDEEEGVEPPRD
jgi:uncharacterized protein (DUF736 family)